MGSEHPEGDTGQSRRAQLDALRQEHQEGHDELADDERDGQRAIGAAGAARYQPASSGLLAIHMSMNWQNAMYAQKHTNAKRSFPMLW